MPERLDTPIAEIHIAHNFSYADATEREAYDDFGTKCAEGRDCYRGRIDFMARSRNQNCISA